jgi:hypothetical protein
MNMFIRQIDAVTQKWNGRWICLETGEIIDNAEYSEWLDALRFMHNGSSFKPIYRLRTNNNRPLVSGFFDAEDAVTRLAFDLRSARPLIEDVNPDEIIGDSCTDMLNVGSAEHRLVPQFTELKDWEGSEVLFELAMTISRCLAQIRVRITNGDRICHAEAERICSLLSMFIDNITPLTNPQIKKHSLFAAELRALNLTRLNRELQDANRKLRTCLTKRNRLIRHLRKSRTDVNIDLVSVIRLFPDLTINSTNVVVFDRNRELRIFSNRCSSERNKANAPEHAEQRKDLSE